MKLQIISAVASLPTQATPGLSIRGKYSEQEKNVVRFMHARQNWWALNSLAEIKMAFLKKQLCFCFIIKKKLMLPAKLSRGCPGLWEWNTGMSLPGHYWLQSSLRSLLNKRQVQCSSECPEVCITRALLGAVLAGVRTEWAIEPELPRQLSVCFSASG